MEIYLFLRQLGYSRDVYDHGCSDSEQSSQVFSYYLQPNPCEKNMPDGHANVLAHFNSSKTNNLEKKLEKNDALTLIGKKDIHV